jgi:hypothetical protein
MAREVTRVAKAMEHVFNREHNNKVRMGLEVFEFPRGLRSYAVEQLRDERTPDERRRQTVAATARSWWRVVKP